MATVLAALTVAALIGVLYSDWLDPVEGRIGLFAAVGTGVAGALYYLAVVRRKASFALRAPADIEDA